MIPISHGRFRFDIFGRKQRPLRKCVRVEPVVSRASVDQEYCSNITELHAIIIYRRIYSITRDQSRVDNVSLEEKNILDFWLLLARLRAGWNDSSVSRHDSSGGGEESCRLTIPEKICARYGQLWASQKTELFHELVVSGHSTKPRARLLDTLRRQTVRAARRRKAALAGKEKEKVLFLRTTRTYFRITLIDQAVCSIRLSILRDSRDPWMHLYCEYSLLD
jgi:hypothetical protein